MDLWEEKRDAATRDRPRTRCRGRSTAFAAASLLGLAVAFTTVTAAPAAAHVRATHRLTQFRATHHARRTAAGKVASVGGSSASGTCGAAGGTGSFTLTSFRHGGTVTVNVTSSTGFAEPGATTPSFAGVCVGSSVFVFGTRPSTGTAGGSTSDSTGTGTGSGGTTITATKVFVVPTQRRHVHHHPPVVAGKVATVGGSGAAGTCGAAGGTGSFTLMTFEDAHGTTVTVDVTSSTTFTGPGKSSASFGNVCVGGDVFVLGTSSSTDSTGTSGATGTTGSSGTTGATGTGTGTSNSGASPITAAKVFVAPMLRPDRHAGQPGATRSARFHDGSTGPMSTHGFAGPGQRSAPGGKHQTDDHPRPTTPSPTGIGSSNSVSGWVTGKGPSSLSVSFGENTRTVDVTSTTTYSGPGGPTSFGAIVRGDLVRATGATANGVFTATAVTVLPGVGSDHTDGAPQPGNTTPPSFQPAPQPTASPGNSQPPASGNAGTTNAPWQGQDPGSHGQGPLGQGSHGPGTGSPRGSGH
jgi:collagen type VII alpha